MTTLLATGRRLQRPHQYVNGVLMLLCRGIFCDRADVYLPETDFYVLHNERSACGRASECKRCSTIRRRSNRRTALKDRTAARAAERGR